MTTLEGSMSTPLVIALRESCDYLRDGGYHQTAQLMTAAADEIERLNHRVRTLEAARRSDTVLRRAAGATHKTTRTGRPVGPSAGN
jgi:hypothetical protein